MRLPFLNHSSRRLQDKAKDAMRELKVMESQQALLEAATSTADAANFVTTRLKSKLEDSMAQIESTARILNDALIICDDSGAVQAFNPAAERLFGLEDEAVLKTFVGDLFLNDSQPFDKSDIWDLLGHIDQAEDAATLKGLRADKSTFGVEVNHTRLDRSDGSAIALMILRSRDSEIELSTSLRNYRSIFESNFDGILVVKDHHIVAANPAAMSLFGYGVSELLSKSLDMIIIPTKDRVVCSEAVEVEVRGKHHDGHLMELSFTITTILWNGSNASLVTIKEVPAQETGPNMICFFDADFIITFANAAYARFHKMKRADLTGKDIRSLMSAEECNPFLLHINNLSEQEPTRRMQLRSNDKDGNTSHQIWTDHASFEEGAVEYQRIGRDVTPKGPQRES